MSLIDRIDEEMGVHCLGLAYERGYFHAARALLADLEAWKALPDYRAEVAKEVLNRFQVPNVREPVSYLDDRPDGQAESRKRSGKAATLLRGLGS